MKGAERSKREARYSCSNLCKSVTDNFARCSALIAVRKAGVVVQVGMLAAGDQPIAIAPLVSKEISLRGTFRFNTEIDDAVSMISENPWIEEAITHIFPVEEAIAGFEMAKNSELSGKVLIAL